MLTWAGEPVHRGNQEMLYEGPAGERMGWASMETRIAIRRLPRAGDRVQSFSAVIGLADKTSHRIQWVYDVDAGDLLTTFQIVNLAFDTGARRPLRIPERLRAAERTVLHEALAPTRADDRVRTIARVTPVDHDVAGHRQGRRRAEGHSS
jgi:acyl-CoA thioesterase FadM